MIYQIGLNSTNGPHYMRVIQKDGQTMLFMPGLIDPIIIKDNGVAIEVHTTMPHVPLQLSANWLEPPK